MRVHTPVEDAAASVPAAPAARPALRPLLDIDWDTTLIAAMSFALHFGAVGALWSDWMDEVISDEGAIARTVEALGPLPIPPATETPADAAEHAATTTVPTTTAPKPNGRTSAGDGAGSGRGSGAGRLADARADAISAELRRLGLEVTGVLNGSGPATDGVLRGGDAPMRLLEGLASSDAGAARGSALAFGSSGGPVRPGHRPGLDGIGNKDALAPVGIGSAAAPRGPSGGRTTVGQPIGDPACNVSDAASVVAALRGRLRACYVRGLSDEDPTMRGSVRLTARIGPAGEVLSVRPSGGSGLSSAVVACAASRVASSTFAPPSCGGATLVIPVIFDTQ